jgi:hypothetical protein
MLEATVVEVEFCYLPREHQMVAMALMSDGEIVDLVQYFTDEHSWSEFDFLGRTLAGVRAHVHETYVRYFQS